MKLPFIFAMVFVMLGTLLLVRLGGVAVEELKSLANKKSGSRR